MLQTISKKCSVSSLAMFVIRIWFRSCGREWGVEWRETAATCREHRSTFINQEVKDVLNLYINWTQLWLKIFCCWNFSYFSGWRWDKAETYQPSVAQATSPCLTQAECTSILVSLSMVPTSIFMTKFKIFKLILFLKYFARNSFPLPPQLARSGGVAACIEIACLGLRSAIYGI